MAGPTGIGGLDESVCSDCRAEKTVAKWWGVPSQAASMTILAAIVLATLLGILFALQRE